MMQSCTAIVCIAMKNVNRYNRTDFCSMMQNVAKICLAKQDSEIQTVVAVITVAST